MTLEYTEKRSDGKWSLVVVVESVLDVAEAMHQADKERRPWRIRIGQTRVFTNARYLAMMKAAES